MKRTLTTLACLLTAAAVLAPAGASAKGKPTKFVMYVKGEQITNWVFEKAVEPTCDYPDSGYGRQYIEFHTGPKKGVKVDVVKAKNGGVHIYPDDVKDLRLEAHAEMSRNFKTLYSQMSPCGDDTPPVGWGHPDEIGQNTCEQWGELEMSTGASILDVENIAYPTGIDPKDDPKGAFYFSADPAWGADEDVSLPEACDQFEQYNADMGLTETQGEWAGAIPPVGGVLKAKRLLKKPKGKGLRVELHDTITYPNAVQTWAGPSNTIGKTVMDVDVTLLRAGK